jgi:hypothetical protein
MKIIYFFALVGDFCFWMSVLLIAQVDMMLHIASHTF